jgi:hypothetical protein
MRSTLLALQLAVLSVIVWPATQVIAQGTKTARGTIVAIADDSLTVKVGAQEMKFSIDDKTIVVAPGATTKTSQATGAGKPGPKLSEVVKVGQAVTVNYADTGGNLHASRVRAVATAGAGGGSVSTSGESAEMTSNGTVKSVSADSITITGTAGGGASFTQTFTIDANTKVIGKGAGTATAATGGKAPIMALVATGDHVSVSYSKMGGTLHASDVRVTAKGAMSK